MLRPIACGLLLLLFPGFAAQPARAADDVLQVVPDDVLGVVVVNHPAKSRQKLNALAERLQLPLPDVLFLVRQQLGNLEGLDENGSAAMAAVPGEDATGPARVNFLPVRDYDQLLRSAGAGQAQDGISQGTVADRPTLIARKGNFAVLADPTARPALKRAVAASGNLATQMAPVIERVAQADIYAAAAPAGIRMAQQQLLAGLAGVRAQLEQQGEQGRQAIAGIAMYEELFRGLDREITHAVAGAQIEERDTVRIVLGTALAPGGMLAKLGGAATAPRFDLLADLPQEEFVFAGGGILPEEWGEQMMNLSMQMMKMYFGQTQFSDEQLRTIVDASLNSLRGMQGMSMMMGLPEAGQPLYGNTLMVIKVRDARRYMENYAAAMEEMSRVMKDMEKAPFSYSSRKLQIGDVPGLEITMDMRGMMGTDGGQQVEQLFKMMFGSAEGVSFYLAPRDQTTVLGTYISKERLEKFLKQDVSQPLSRDPHVAKTIALLPKDAQAIAVWSVPGTARFVSQVLAAVQPEAAGQVPLLPPSPPIGFSAQMSAQRLDADVVLPGELLQALAAFIQQMQAGQQGPDQP